MALDGLKTEIYSFPRRASSFTPVAKGSIYCPDVESDITLNVDGVSFSLHKFPLMKKSLRIRRLVGEELNEGNFTMSSPAVIEFTNFPGGPETFELLIKFCYGINFEMTTLNVANLRCAAEFLEMIDEHGEENIITHTETFLSEIVFRSLDKTVEVLHSCEHVLSMAEEVKLVNRCIDVIASKIYHEQQKLSNRLQAEGNHSIPWNYNSTHLRELQSAILPTPNWNQDEDSTPVPHTINRRVKVDWWAEKLSLLRIDLYQRVFTAMKASGVRAESLAGSLMKYAESSLKHLHGQGNQGASVMMSAPFTTAIRLKTKHHLDINFGHNHKTIQQHEQRNVLETIISLLPTENNLFPISFLLSLLRDAIALDTTVACQLDLERRIGLQLERVTANDLLIPTLPSDTDDAMYDVDLVQRVLVNYLQQDENFKNEHNFSLNSDSDENGISLNYQKGIRKVTEVIVQYLAEIAADANLRAAKFAAIAEKLPSHFRAMDDGLYRAIDIFLKAHPYLTDVEKRKVCKLLDCQKLSREACFHAAQNERLPVEMLVKVLYCEQMRIRNALVEDESPHQEGSYNYGGYSLNKISNTGSPRMDTLSRLRQKNKFLKEEVAKLQLRVAELEKENTELKLGEMKTIVASGNSVRFFSSVSRRLGRMNPFSSKHKDAAKQRDHCLPPPRQRRHSVS
ncbi:hypothetical protein KP509_26G037900 [Ceratopteris richardii]|nr:hypothetical protein KP509_26G037900 [Ceratopteris richardii]